MRDGRAPALLALPDWDTGVAVNEPASNSAATILLYTCPCAAPVAELAHGVDLDLSAAVMLLERVLGIL
jgi:hypothetical protein